MQFSERKLQKEINKWYYLKPQREKLMKLK